MGEHRDRDPEEEPEHESEVSDESKLTRADVTAATVFQATLPHDARVFRDAFVYGAVIVVLLVRPQGLFAPKSSKQRV